MYIMTTVSLFTSTETLDGIAVYMSLMHNAVYSR